MFVVVWFLDTEALGLATMAMAVGVVFEAFHSLGMDKALVQDKTLTLQETHSVFWFGSAYGIVLYLLAMPIAWISAWFYNIPELVPLTLVMMLKMPLNSIAFVPWQIINRRFEFNKSSVGQAVSTFASCAAKIGFAIAGFGAWALVLGELAYAIAALIFAFSAARYLPALHFRFSECRRFIIYGAKYMLSNLLDQLSKNLHYLIVGKCLGEGILGVYRIAYELAMTPALALFNVVAKSSFPIFSRLQDDRPALSRLFAWNQKNLALFAAIPTVLILFAAIDIFELMPNESWRSATAIIPFVLCVSFVKSLMQTYPDLFRACGKPLWPLYFQLSEAAFIAAAFCGILHFMPTVLGLNVTLLLWCAFLALLSLVYGKAARKFVDTNTKSLLCNVAHGVGFILFSSALSLPFYLLRNVLPHAQWTHLAIEILVIIFCLFVYVRFVLKGKMKDFLKMKK